MISLADTSCRLCMSCNVIIRCVLDSIYFSFFLCLKFYFFSSFVIFGFLVV